jgi:hypothetical protein
MWYLNENRTINAHGGAIFASAAEMKAKTKLRGF